jgi:release factor glutamine methyltransferase
VGIESADLDARVLLAHSLGSEPAQLLATPDRPVDLEAETHFRSLIARRAAHEPVARIVGKKEFWSRDFSLSPGTLVPRPETETIIETALREKPDRNAPLRVLDLGTGSGILLGAILLEWPRASGVGVDRNTDAIETARRNLTALGVGGRAEIAQGDWARGLDEKFDLVVSNPPYVKRADLVTLAQDVRDYDPREALDGGADGLDAYRAIIADLERLLAPRGVAILELGQGQEDAVAEIVRRAHLMVNNPAVSDLSGVPRALIVKAA